MLNLSQLPPVPQPPHDPTWWLLNSRTGWHEADLTAVEISAATQSLSLTPLPSTLPSLTDPTGSFGGLTLPASVAVSSDGSIFLLDGETGILKRFDSCGCEFKPVPCLGGILQQFGPGDCEVKPGPCDDGAGTDPRKVKNPHGIGICRDNLFICDTENHRLSVFSLRGFVLRDIWEPPSAAANNRWKPYSLAFDRLGRLFVSDTANGLVHRFNSYGVWEKSLAGFESVRDIAIDCLDRLYVVSFGVNQSVRIVGADGEDLGTATRSDSLKSYFPLLPFSIDSKGQLDLCALCDASKSKTIKCPLPEEVLCVFDLHGNPTGSRPVTVAIEYSKEGTLLTSPLDSGLYRCVWHRIVLSGEIPSGASIRVMTYTAETSQSTDYIQSLPEDAWATNQTARQLEKGSWDCLITSDGGRYLWLRIQLRSGGFSTPLINQLRIEFPRISLRRYLPSIFGEDAGGASFTDRFLSIFDTTLRDIEKKVDDEARLFDPLSTPTTCDPKTGIDFLTWLASWIGVTSDRQFSLDQRRLMLKRAASSYNLRGTLTGLRRQLLFLLGMEPEGRCCPGDTPLKQCTPTPQNCIPVEETPCTWQPPPLILEHFQIRRWLFVGSGKLGDQAVLWGQRIVNRSQLDESARVGQTQLITTQDPFRDPFHVYAHKFSAFVPACYGRSDSLRRGLENLLNSEKPGHTQFQLIFVEPRFRIGFQSMIGLDSVVGSYPSTGVTLNKTPLGGASVLTAAPEKRGTPSFELGNQSRVGTTTKLE